MKKIILFLLLSFCFISNSKASIITSEVRINSNGINICMDGESYPIKKIGGPGSNLYFLNPSKDYNYNFEDYYELAWEDSPYDKKISEYVSYYYKHGYDSYYYETTVKKLWEAAYPGHYPYFCSSTSQLVNIMLETEEMMNNVSSGPDFINRPNYLDEGEERSYGFTYINYFEVVDSSGLDVKIGDNNFIVKADKPGEYDVILKRKKTTSESPAMLYTDGTNYLITNGAFPDTEYKAKFYVGYKKFSFTAVDETGEAITNSPFIIYKDGEKYLDIETDWNGTYEGYLPIGEYYITNSEKTHKEYFFIEDDFALKTIIAKTGANKESSSLNTYPSFVESVHNATIDKAKDIIANFSNGASANKEISVVFPDTLWLT